MNVEQILTDELRSVAASVEAPLPPIAGLVRDAERARTRTLRTRLAGTVLVAAAVVGAIVLGTQVGRPNTAPPPTNPSPSYYAAGVPYVLDGVLYIDHQPQPGSWRGSMTVGEYTSAVRPADNGLATVVIFRDGVQVDTVPGVIYGPVFSARGTKLAWLTGSGDPGAWDAGTLVVRDLTTFRDLGRLPVRLVERDGSGLSLSMGVDDDGTVSYSINDVTRSWRPGSDPVPAEEPPGQSVLNPPGFPDIDARVQLSPDHLWGAWLTDARGRPLPPDGAPEGVTVQKPGVPESRFTITVTDDTELDPFLSWMSPTELVVIGVPTDVRCDIVTRQCQD